MDGVAALGGIRGSGGKKVERGGGGRLAGLADDVSPRALVASDHCTESSDLAGGRTRLPADFPSPEVKKSR